MSLPPIRYVILYDGCKPEEIEYSYTLTDSLRKLANMNKWCTRQPPRIEIYKLNEHGEYVNANEPIFIDEINLGALSYWESQNNM